MGEMTNILGKLPPQAIDIEIAVLGSIMIERNAINEVISVLKPDMFYKESHKHIFKSIVRLFSKSEPIDIMTVTEDLRSLGLLEVCGGSYGVSELTLNINSSSNIEVYARVIVENYLRREAIRLSNETSDMSYDTTVDVFDVLSHVESTISVLVSDTVSKELKFVREAITDSLMKMYEAKDLEMTGVPTGLRDLDEMKM